MREIRRLLAAAANSLRGWAHLLETEPNMRYLLLLVTATAATGVAGLLTVLEVAVLLVALCIAVGLEICNTAVEELLDLRVTGYSERVKILKDIMSGAVFFSLLLYAVLLLLFITR